MSNGKSTVMTGHYIVPWSSIKLPPPKKNKKKKTITNKQNTKAQLLCDTCSYDLRSWH